MLSPQTVARMSSRSRFDLAAGLVFVEGEPAAGLLAPDCGDTITTVRFARWATERIPDRSADKSVVLLSARFSIMLSIKSDNAAGHSGNNVFAAGALFSNSECHRNQSR